MLSARSLTLTLALLLTLPGTPARADVDGQGWVQLLVQGRLAEPRLRWVGEVQPRFGRNFTDADRLLLRPALGWEVAPGWSLWLGYAWTPLLTPLQHEHRPYQQLLAESTLGPVALVNRTRFEQRFIEGAGGPSLRARHLVRGVWGPLPATPALRLAASEELFVNLNGVTGGPAGGLDQNRAFVGLNVLVNAALQLEAGYLHNHVWRAGGDDRVNHVLLIVAFVTVP